MSADNKRPRSEKFERGLKIFRFLAERSRQAD
jgi:hypothetical protein